MARLELRYDAGRQCLNLLATIGGGLSNSPVERLDSPARLAEWLVGAGLVAADNTVAVDERWLADFISLRRLIHRVLHSELRDEPISPVDLDALNVLANVPPPAQRLLRDEAGRLQRLLAEPVSCESLLSVIASDAIDLLVGEHRAQLRECEGDTCDLVYLDNSRGRRRRWCASQACGNRQRVAAFRDRQLGAAG